MKIEPFLLVSTLDIVIGQRLVRRLTENKEKFFMNNDEISQLGKIVNLDRILNALKAEKIVATDNWNEIPFFKAIQTQEDDGYKGRVGIHEILIMTSGIKDLIMKDASTDDIEEEAKKEGMLTMLEDGIFKCVQGLTTLEEVLRVVSTEN
jgi:type II secretory ATPase GspE/PulE/Tfp pilus assembly ATPase PilB-like protein